MYRYGLIIVLIGLSLTITPTHAQSSCQQITVIGHTDSNIAALYSAQNIPFTLQWISGAASYRNVVFVYSGTSDSIQIGQNAVNHGASYLGEVTGGTQQYSQIDTLGLSIGEQSGSVTVSICQVAPTATATSAPTSTPTVTGTPPTATATSAPSATPTGTSTANPTRIPSVAPLALADVPHAAAQRATEQIAAWSPTGAGAPLWSLIMIPLLGGLTRLIRRLRQWRIDSE